MEVSFKLWGSSFQITGAIYEKVYSPYFDLGTTVCNEKRSFAERIYEVSSEDEPYDYSYIINNERLHQITKTVSITEYYEKQQSDWMAHVIRRDNLNLCKILTFHSTVPRRLGRRTPSILQRAVSASGLSRSQYLRTSFLKKNKRWRYGVFV